MSVAGHSNLFGDGALLRLHIIADCLGSTPMRGMFRFANKNKITFKHRMDKLKDFGILRIESRYEHFLHPCCWSSTDCFSFYDDDMNDYKKKCGCHAELILQILLAGLGLKKTKPHLQQQKPIVHAAMALVKLSRYKATISLSSEVRPLG
jgi:hypothetical protein